MLTSCQMSLYGPNLQYKLINWPTLYSVTNIDHQVGLSWEVTWISLHNRLHCLVISSRVICVISFSHGKGDPKRSYPLKDFAT
jgi:hypothetical protein